MQINDLVEMYGHTYKVTRVRQDRFSISVYDKKVKYKVSDYEFDEKEKVFKQKPAKVYYFSIGSETAEELNGEIKYKIIEVGEITAIDTSRLRGKILNHLKINSKLVMNDFIRQEEVNNFYHFVNKKLRNAKYKIWFYSSPDKSGNPIYVL